MSKTIGIICEYNPFHNGHKYQIDRIREEIDDATIVIIMSGSTVQRGEFSIFDKYTRARVALECGADAVFELPYPYSSSCAEIFARAGVNIATNLGCDYLYFGTESKNIEHIESVAKALDSLEFEEYLKEELLDKNQSFISAKERALKRMSYEIPNTSNDMLALEYIRAIKALNSDMKYKAIQRKGANYNDENICETMSATAIRKNFKENSNLLSVPWDANSLYENEINDGNVLDERAFNDFIYKYALITPRILFDEAFDSNKEIGAIIKESASNSKTANDFIEGLSSKVYTSSRIKRVILYTVFGIKTIEKVPNFTLLLAANDNGKKIINKTRKNDNFTIITKHSDGKNLSVEQKQMLEKNYEIYGVFSSFLKKPVKSKDIYSKKPIIE